MDSGENDNSLLEENGLRRYRNVRSKYRKTGIYRSLFAVTKTRHGSYRDQC